MNISSQSQLRVPGIILASLFGRAATAQTDVVRFSLARSTRPRTPRNHGFTTVLYFLLTFVHFRGRFAPYN